MASPTRKRRPCGWRSSCWRRSVAETRPSRPRRCSSRRSGASRRYVRSSRHGSSGGKPVDAVMFIGALKKFLEKARTYSALSLADRLVDYKYLLSSVDSIHSGRDSLTEVEKRLKDAQEGMDSKRNGPWDGQAALDEAKAAYSSVLDTAMNMFVDATEKDLVANQLQLAEAEAIFMAAKQSRDQLQLNDLLAKYAPRVPDASLPEWFIPKGTVAYDPEPFARGSFGSVHSGTWGSGARVVVKKFFVNTGENSIGDKYFNLMLQRVFMMEADLWSRLKHPYVCQLWGACQVSEPPFMVCESAVKNGNLANYIHTATGKKRFWGLLYHAALGVEYLHDKNIIHGNLKLNNVLVGDDGYSRVTDSGLSRFKRSSDVYTTRVEEGVQSAGALRWRAPECIGSTMSPQKTSDVYSLALCIYEAFDGAPYGTLDDTSVKERILSGHLPDQPENCPDEAWELIKKMTAKDPKDRPDIATVTDELYKFVAEEEKKEYDGIQVCVTCGTEVPAHGGQRCQKCLKVVETRQKDDTGLADKIAQISHRVTDNMDGRLDVLQEIVRCGAKWDKACEAVVHGSELHLDRRRQVQWTKTGPAIKYAVQLWIEERDLGQESFTQIPGEEIERGLEATEIFAKEFKASKLIVCRRTICVVGSSTVGKTSLIKSLIGKDICLEHTEDRTIGIDRFLLEFDEPNQMPAAIPVKHQVVFSDFAGQNVYQGMHSLFFTRHTLFMICVDLNAYSVALLKAEMLTQNDVRKQHLMNEYVNQTVLSHIHIILGRQSAAEFEFMCTKKDTVSEGPGVEEEEVLAHVNMMLARVMAIVNDLMRAKEGTIKQGELPIAHLWEPRLPDCPKLSHKAIVASFATKSSAIHVRTEIERLVMSSAHGYETPEKYMLVLEALTQMVPSAENSPTCDRIRHAFVHIGVLVGRLCETVPGLNEDTAKSVVQSLRDCSEILWYEILWYEILWYEDMQNQRLKTTVILDPPLLTDFLKQTINHKTGTGLAYHSTLSGLPFWSDLKDDQPLMLSMKTLLHEFHLVHPAFGEMAYGSDLIVPAYWKTNRAAVREFGGDVLRLNPGTVCDLSGEPAVQRRVHWEFRFPHFIPHTLFVMLVVASYSPIRPLKAGPDWILYRDSTLAACRVVVSRHWKSHERSLLLEAVVADTPSVEKRAALMWSVFQRVCKALARVLKEHPGLSVTSFAHTDDPRHLPSLSSVFHVDQNVMGDIPWMPPQSVASACATLVTGN